MKERFELVVRRGKVAFKRSKHYSSQKASKRLPSLLEGVFLRRVEKLNTDNTLDNFKNLLSLDRLLPGYLCKTMSVPKAQETFLSIIVTI